MDRGRRRARPRPGRRRASGSSGHDGRRVEPVARPALGHRLVDGRLERVLVDHQVGGAQARDLTRRQLEVVRLGARLGQAGHRRQRPGHLLGDELERVERRDDPQRTSVLRSAGSCSPARSRPRRRAAAAPTSTATARLPNMRIIFIKTGPKSTRACSQRSGSPYHHIGGEDSPTIPNRVWRGLRSRTTLARRRRRPGPAAGRTPASGRTAGRAPGPDRPCRPARGRASSPRGRAPR